MGFNPENLHSTEDLLKKTVKNDSKIGITLTVELVNVEQNLISSCQWI